MRVGAAGVYSYLTVSSARGSARRTPPTTPAFAGSGGIDLQDVTGAGVAELLPAESSELVEGLNATAKRHRLWPWVLALVIVLTFALSPLTLIAGVPALIAALWRDRVQRTLVTFYELDGPPAARYASLIDFSTITTVRKGWHTVAKGAPRTTHQRKVNAGASTVVRREALTRSLAGPPHLASNIAIPTLQSSSRSMYLLPDRALVRGGSRYADIGYDELRAITGPFRFIEDGRVPSDATRRADPTSGSTTTAVSPWSSTARWSCPRDPAWAPFCRSHDPTRQRSSRPPSTACMHPPR